jgi:hypothetical protein
MVDGLEHRRCSRKTHSLWIVGFLIEWSFSGLKAAHDTQRLFVALAKSSTSSPRISSSSTMQASPLICREFQTQFDRRRAQ